MSGRGSKFGALAVLVMVAGAALGFWLRPDWRFWTRPDDDPDDDVPIVAAVNPGYVGIGACTECHAQRVAEFKTTRHFHACVPATGTEAPGQGVIATRDPSLRFEMSRTGDALTATAVQLTSAGEQRRDYRIGLAYGAGGGGDEMYFAWDGDRLTNLPVAWLNPLACWGSTVARAEGREASPSCLECHNTWVAHVPGTPNQYRRDDMLLGVTCERCHGPGDKHVAFHRSHTDKEPRSIFRPDPLQRDRLIEVCTQCHGNTRRRGPAFSYRPGEPLETAYRTLQTRNTEDEQVANQVRYLRESKCFQHSDMTCVTCHNPHRPSKAGAGQRTCLKCHTVETCTDRPRLPSAVRDDCVGCHMPSRVWMNVRFHTRDDDYVPVAVRADHRIAVHPEAKQAVLLAWLKTQSDPKSLAEADRLTEQVALFWQETARKRQEERRFIAAIGALREALKVDPSGKTRQLLREAIARQLEFDRLIDAANAADRRHPAEAIKLMKQILEIRPDHAATHGELGTLYALLGDQASAKAHLQAAATYDPDDSYCVSTLAALAYREGRFDDAISLFAKADGIELYSAGIHHGWGLALLKVERWAEARDQFQQALTIEPRRADCATGLSEAMRRLGQTDDAVLHARRAVRWSNSQDAQALLALGEAYAAAGRSADAGKALEQALAVAEPTNATLATTIRARIAELR